MKHMDRFRFHIMMGTKCTACTVLRALPMLNRHPFRFLINAVSTVRDVGGMSRNRLDDLEVVRTRYDWIHSHFSSFCVVVLVYVSK